MARTEPPGLAELLSGATAAVSRASVKLSYATSVTY
jgi:hypothetical protein